MIINAVNVTEVCMCVCAGCVFPSSSSVDERLLEELRDVEEQCGAEDRTCIKSKKTEQ